jgi:uncharacterized protein (TIGR03437 family)
MRRLIHNSARALTGGFLLTIFLTSLTSSAQSFDTSGDATLQGDYFVREVLITGQNLTTGTLNSAVSATGVVTFDGKGGYKFAGQIRNSATGTTSPSLTGTYQVSSAGLMNMTSLADQTDTVFGGVAAIGPSAIVASATERTNVDILIAIPAGSNVTNGSLKGNYKAGLIDFFNADVTMTRQATFTLTADGAGNLGNVSVSGSAENLGSTQISQTVSGAAYSLSGEGSGTASFGGSTSAQLLSGTKTFYISKDGNIVLGGSPTGYDLIVGIRALSAPASNATASGLYYIAGLEDNYISSQTPPNAVDAFYGSANSNGAGTTLFHNRLQIYTSSVGVYDYTFDGEYTVQSDGTIAPADLPFYQFALGVNGQAFIATGQSSQGLYSLFVGFAAPAFASGTGVYLKPTGIVNSGSFAPITNPIAPNEFITLFGSGLANSPVSATTLPLPTTGLGGVTVSINGQPAPLLYVSPNQIEALVPSTVTPTVPACTGQLRCYATIQVTNNNVASNKVTVYTGITSPGVFTLSGNGIGPAAAQHANFTTITDSSQAVPGETIIVYMTGLGAVTPAIPDGSAAPSNPLSSAIICPQGSPQCGVLIDFQGDGRLTPGFVGLTPTAAGLYQINVAVPSGAGTGAAYFDVATPNAYTSQSTIALAASGARTVKSHSAWRGRMGSLQPLP